MFLWFLMSIFGIFFTYRSTFHLQEIHLLANIFSETARGVLLLLMILINFLLREHQYVHAVLMILQMWLPFVVKTAIELWIFRTWDQKLISLLDSAIVKMKTGLSFRESIKSSMHQFESVHSRIIEEFLVSIQMKQNNFSKYHPHIELSLNELAQIDLLAHKQSDRLKALRRKYKIRQSFKKKSGVALSQIRAQSLILSILYIGLLLFFLFTQSWKAYLEQILLSLFLFSIGSLWILRAGKRYQWKT